MATRHAQVAAAAIVFGGLALLAFTTVVALLMVLEGGKPRSVGVVLAPTLMLSIVLLLVAPNLEPFPAWLRNFLVVALAAAVLGGIAGAPEAGMAVTLAAAIVAVAAAVLRNRGRDNA